MGLDIRFPIGLLFALIGVVLAAFGLLGDQSIYTRSLGLNVNLWWGAVMVMFGAVNLWLSRRHTSAMQPSSATEEGRATEAREHRTGLERTDDRD